MGVKISGKFLCRHPITFSDLATSARLRQQDQQDAHESGVQAIGMRSAQDIGQVPIDQRSPHVDRASDPAHETDVHMLYTPAR